MPSDLLIRNMNALRKRENKRPLTKTQIRMVEEQVAMRARLGRFSLFPAILEKELAEREAAQS